MDTVTYNIITDKIAKLCESGNFKNISTLLVLMYLQNIWFVRLFFFLIELYNLVTASQSKSNRILEPCFEEDETFSKCSKMDSSCAARNADVDDIKLVRLPGIRTGHVRWLQLEEERSYRLITRAMRPLLFEIPDFLSAEECDHIISLAKEMGLSTSIIGRDYAQKSDLIEAINEAGLYVYGNTTADTTDFKSDFARDFNVWDTDKDGVIDTLEIKTFAERYKALRLNGDDIKEMLEHAGSGSIDDPMTQGNITNHRFREWNFRKVLSYMDALKFSSPRHKFRFSDQVWLRQDRTADHVLRRLHERIIKLTRLPRKFIQGSEAMQVVRYQPYGHYHSHYDSGFDPAIPCCHQSPSLKPPQCGLCRFVTILYYLNDVGKGGETAFPVANNFSITWKDTENPEAVEFNLSINCHSANLVLTPKKGTAIMWYNHFIDPDSGLLGNIDLNSLHGGCDVISGEKWIANNWLTAPTKTSKHVKSIYDVGFDE